MAHPRISFFLENILGLIEAVKEIKKQKKIEFFQNWSTLFTAQKKGKNTAKTLKWMCLKPVEGWLMKIWLRNWSSKIFPSPFNTMFIRQSQIKGEVHLVYLYKRVYHMNGEFLLLYTSNYYTHTIGLPKHDQHRKINLYYNNYLLDKIDFERKYLA